MVNKQDLQTLSAELLLAEMRAREKNPESGPRKDLRHFDDATILIMSLRDGISG